jgi:biopolymer transport protein ExbD
MNTPHPRAKSDINITPLIDIVLVLLIVFIVLVPCLSPSLSVVVPQITRRHDPGIDLPVVVTLDHDGKLFLQREEVAGTSLSDRLVPVVLLQPLGLRKIFLKVDGDLPHQQAVNVLDQIRVASDRARRETRAKPGFQEEDGGEIKVAIALLKRDVQG